MEALFMRFLWAVGIALLGVAAYWLVNAFVLAQARQARLPGFRPGTPAVLYFTTPDCLPCKTVQRPALQRLQATLGKEHLQVIEVNAQEKTEMAQAWHVLSVPTTFILDERGQVQFANHGVTREDKLIQQLRRIQ